MGSFNLFNIFSSQLDILPQPKETLSNNTSDASFLTTCLTQNYSGRTKLFDRESEAILQQKQQAIRRFPCEDRHSYNPHYQHNLISELPSYSTPPSLSSSPTNSSPASFNSSKSSMSFSGSRATHGHSSNKNNNHHRNHNHSEQSSSYQNSNSHHGFSGYNTVGSSGGRQYSYMRQQQRRQNQQKQFYEYTDADLVIGASSMALFSPGEPTVLSPSSSTSSLASSSRINYSQQPRQSVSRISTSIAALSSLLENQVSPSKSSVAFSPVGRHHSHTSRRGGDPFSSVGLLPSISETSTSPKMDHVSALGATSSSPLTSPSKNQSKKMTAQKSLRRIAQCASNQDNWCSVKAGQWASHYAETRSRSAMTDGRRHRRL